MSMLRHDRASGECALWHALPLRLCTRAVLVQWPRVCGSEGARVYADSLEEPHVAAEQRWRSLAREASLACLWLDLATCPFVYHYGSVTTRMRTIAL